MITLNLISGEYKEKIKLKRLYYKVESFLTTFLLFILMAAIALSLAKYIMKGNFDDLASLNNFVKQDTKKIFQEIRSINDKITAAANVQKRYLGWSPIIIAFSETIPEGIEIHSLNISKNNWLISGEAKNREVLLIFKTNLEKLKYFSAIKSPIANLLQKENIGFQLEGIFKSEK
jgi:hypothetical protein